MFNKLSNKQVLKPINRIYSASWQQLGAVKREPDSRTLEQLKVTVDSYVDKIPEVKEFVEGHNRKSKEMIVHFEKIKESGSYDLGLDDDVNKKAASAI